MDLESIARFRERHPAWKLLRATNAPLILAFLGESFVENNRGAMSASELVSELDDYLYALHQRDPDSYPASPQSYIEDWASSEHGWLRRFYPQGSDEVHLDITPALETAYRWVEGLRERTFIGSESRMQILVELLRQIVYGSETDPEERIKELERRRAAIDAEIELAKNNELTIMDGTALRDRFQQFVMGSRDLLADFRQVEENFRGLDRSAREKIAVWNGSKGELLEDFVATRTDISSSDQGRNFNAFYDFLVSEQRQEEITKLLASAQSIAELGADRRIRTVHHDWAMAADRTQQTVRDLSEQLRRFLEERVWLENRRILDLARAIEGAAVRIREAPASSTEGLGLEIEEIGLNVALPMERPLYAVRPNSDITSLIQPSDEGEMDLDALLDQHYVDMERLAVTIRSEVARHSSAGLADIIAEHPIEEGLAELLGYLSLNEEDITLEFDDVAADTIWIGEPAFGAGEAADGGRDSLGSAADERRRRDRLVTMPQVKVVRS